MVKVCVGPVTLFRLTDNRRKMQQCATNSPEQHARGFELRVFPPSHRPVVYIYIYIYACVCVYIHTQIYTHVGRNELNLPKCT